MRIPTEDAKKLDLYREVQAACLASRQDRLQRYAANRRWYLYGNAEGSTPSPWNKIYSHLDTVSSFLYASETTNFSVRLKSRATKADHVFKAPFGRRLNEAWKDSNADIIWGQAILWSLIYDTTLVKHIRRSGEVHPFVVDPGSFGVYREDVPMLDRQEAFVHVFYMTHSDLQRQLALHPKREDILKAVTAARTKDDTSSQMPALVDRVVMSAVSPNLMGEVNVPLEAPPEYAAKLDVEVIEISEMWVWDDAQDDYQVVTMASDNAVIYDRSNIFIPRQKGIFEAEQPFVQVCPNPLYDYFWGVAEVNRLAPLQAERNQIRDDINKLIAKQVDPPTTYFGMGMAEEKLAALNIPGAQLVAGDASTKLDRYVPTIPADIYTRKHENDNDFDEVSGLTNVLAGRGEAGVRSSGHASKLATLASSRPKKRALIIEDSLEQSATLFGKCLYLDDDDPLETADSHKFVISQMSPHFAVDVDGHSNSPVFMDNMKEDAVLLLKSRAINRKRFVKMIRPPMEDDILDELEHEIIPSEQRAAQAQQAAELQKQGGAKLEAVK